MVATSAANQLSDPTVSNEPSTRDVGYGDDSNESGSGDDAVSVTASVDPAWTENTNVPRRNMSIIQVASLVINQTMSASIFTLPATVLSITGSKQLGVGLWVLGGVYTVANAIMFVEYSSALPYTGGPLIWLDEVFPKPAMLASTIFAWYWNLLATNGNVQAVARSLISLARPGEPVSEYPEGLERLVSVFVITVICILLYMARRACFMFNTATALFKVILTLVIFISGITTAVKKRPESGLTDFSYHKPSESNFDILSAMIYVTYSYSGWEHTNYIAGEIKHPKKSLRTGVFAGVIIVTILYILVVVANYAALSFEEIVFPENSLYGSLDYNFANKVFGSTRGIAVLSMVSGGSCVIANAYTMAKVRQAIAWQRIVPFYQFIGRQDRQFDSPGGALLMQWFFTVLQIAGTPYDSSASNFWANLYTYGYEIELAALAMGLLWLAKRMRYHEEQWRFQNIPNKWTLVLLVTTLVGFSLVVLIAVATDSTSGIHNYYMSVGLASIAIAAFSQWSLLWLMSHRGADGQTVGQKIFGVEVNIYTCSDDESELSDSLKALMREARADGTCRRVEYQVRGPVKRAVDKISEWLGFVVKWLE